MVRDGPHSLACAGLHSAGDGLDGEWQPVDGADTQGQGWEASLPVEPEVGAPICLQTATLVFKQAAKHCSVPVNTMLSIRSHMAGSTCHREDPVTGLQVQAELKRLTLQGEEGGI